MDSSKKIIDPKAFGKMAIKRKFANQEQIDAALKEWKKVTESGGSKDFGALLIKNKVLTKDQLKELLKRVATQKSKRRVGNFELLSKIGEGGMGTVYKARQLGIDREIALKILPPDLAKESDFQERFFREARAVAKLNHPNIVTGIDVGTSNGVYYFAMEFVDGQSLGQRLQKKGKLSEKRRLGIHTADGLGLASRSQARPLSPRR